MKQIKCTSCGATQEIENNQSCEYCGNLIEVEKAEKFYDDVISGEFGNYLIMADTALEAEDYVEAINYYNKILEKDIKYADAWLGKANGMIYTSKIGDIKMKEALTYWKNSIKFSEDKESMNLRVGHEINRVINSFFPNILNHYIEFSSTRNAYGELAERFMTLESGIKYACEICPEKVEFFETGNSLCELVITSPTNVATGNQGAALAEGLIGAFSGNKYSRERAFSDAGNAYQEAAELKKTINQFGSQIKSLKQFYVDGLIRLGVFEETQKLAPNSNKDSINSKIDASLIDEGEFKKLKNIFYGILIVPFLIYIPTLIAGDVSTFFFGYLIVFGLLYFLWLNKRSKKRLGFPFNDLWKIRNQIGIKPKVEQSNEKKPPSF